MLVALACLLPPLAVVGFVLSRSVMDSRDRLLDSQAITAQVVATAIEGVLEETQGVLERLAALEEIRTPNAATAGTLAQFRNARPSWYGLVLLDAEGGIVATSGLDELSQVPSGLSPAVSSVFTTSQVVVSRRLFAPDGAVIAVAAPVLAGDAAEGKAGGAVVGLLPVDR